MAGRPRRMYRKVLDAFDVLLDAAGRLHNAAPDKYLDSLYEGPMDDPWRRALDAMMAACVETEKIARILAKNAGLPEPGSHLSEFAEKSIISDPEPAAD